MIVRACDACKKFNTDTEVGPLNFVHIVSHRTKMALDGFYGPDYKPDTADLVESITISPETATTQVARPNRELCNECTGVAVAEALKNRK